MKEPVTGPQAGKNWVDSILETLPTGWRQRLVLVPEARFAFALDPHDLVAVKLLVGGPKDLARTQELQSGALLPPEVVRQRIDVLDIPIECIPRILPFFGSMFSA